jgi:hypothetical protein
MGRVIPSAMFRCPHCGQAGVAWSILADDLGPLLPRASAGFHVEIGRGAVGAAPLVICDRCDEIQAGETVALEN